MGGFLKMVLSKGWFCVKFQSSIRIVLRYRTYGWYVVTKGKTRLRVLLICKRADCLVAKLTSDSVLRISFLGYPRLIRRNLNLKRLSPNIVSEEYRICRPTYLPILGRHIGWLSVDISAESVDRYLVERGLITHDPKRHKFSFMNMHECECLACGCSLSLHCIKDLGQIS